MSRQNINVGTNPNDATGDTLRLAFSKVNNNFIELYATSAGAGNSITQGSYSVVIDANGAMSFPTLSTARGDVSSGTLTGQTLKFADKTQEAIIAGPDGDVDYNNAQRIVIEGGLGAANTTGEGGDIYVWAGRGGDYGGSGGDVKVRGGYGANTYGDGGYVRIEGGDAANIGAGGFIDINGGNSYDGSAGYVTIRGGYTSNNGQHGYVNIQTNGGTWYFNNDGTTRFPGNRIEAPINYGMGLKTTTESGDDNQVYLGSNSIDLYAYRTAPNTYAYSEIYLDNDDVNAPFAYISMYANNSIENRWKFNANGSLTLPVAGNLVQEAYSAGPYTIQDGNYYGGDDAEVYLDFTDNQHLDLLFKPGDFIFDGASPESKTPLVSLTNDGSFWTVTANQVWLGGVSSIGFSRVGGTWTFGSDGVLTFPLINSQPYIQKQRFGMGNVAAYLDGQWTICEYNGTSYGTQGIRINPAVEGYADIYLPSDANAPNDSLGISNYAGNVAIVGLHSNTWTFNGNTNALILPNGGFIRDSAVANTLTLSPPHALFGQSLVIRPTSPTGVTSDHPGGFVSGDAITVYVNPDNGNAVTGTVDYTFTGCSQEQLGIPLTGTLTFTASSIEQISWNIPSASDITSFTITLSNPAGFGLGGATTLTVTRNGSSEDNHIHLIAGNTSTVDLYLGDDDQYVKIEKNAGNVVIGTNTNSKHWTFDVDGTLTLPSDTFSINFANGSAAVPAAATTIANNGNTLYIDSYGNTHLPSHIVFHDVPTTSKGAAGDKMGEMTTDGINLYVCYADYTDGVDDIWSRTTLSPGNWP